MCCSDSKQYFFSRFSPIHRPERDLTSQDLQDSMNSDFCKQFAEKSVFQAPGVALRPPGR
jgi:hypothetical protein